MVLYPLSNFRFLWSRDRWGVDGLMALYPLLCFCHLVCRGAFALERFSLDGPVWDALLALHCSCYILRGQA
jgi:hypothetical protein